MVHDGGRRLVMDGGEIGMALEEGKKEELEEF